MSTLRRIELADFDGADLGDWLARAIGQASIGLDTTVITDHGEPLAAIVPVAPGTWDEGLATVPLGKLSGPYADGGLAEWRRCNTCGHPVTTDGAACPRCKP
jgi:hypothetical protein